MTPASEGAAIQGPTIGVILKGWPRLSETFIAEELRALEAAGLRLHLIALRQPTDRVRHPVHDQVQAPVLYLPEYLHQAPQRVLSAWWRVRRRPGYGRALRAWLADLVRDPSRSRIRRFGQALVLAAELGPRIRFLYAHFIHTPASVARYAGVITGLDWAVSAHAKDIWTSPDWDLAAKLRESAWVITCTAAGRDRLQALSPPGRSVTLAYHGLDPARFPSPLPRARAADGRDPHDPVVILSVGRLVEKKGYPDLIGALARLPPDLAWRFVHIGGGDPQALIEAATRAGIADRIIWTGAAAQPAVLAAYRAADLFVLASRIAADGDRDGLPNVLVEAQSQHLPCLSTAVAGVPELIEPGRTGLLVPPGDVAALAGSLACLIRDPGLRHRLGAAGAARVARDFGFGAGPALIAERLRQASSRVSGPVLGPEPAASACACESPSTPR